MPQELKFWLQHVDAFNGYAIKKKFSATATVYSDASDTWFGGYSALIGSDVSCENWSEFDAAQSSTFREMKAMLNGFQTVRIRVELFQWGALSLCCKLFL